MTFLLLRPDMGQHFQIFELLSSGRTLLTIPRSRLKIKGGRISAIRAPQSTRGDQSLLLVPSHFWRLIYAKQLSMCAVFLRYLFIDWFMFYLLYPNHYVIRCTPHCVRYRVSMFDIDCCKAFFWYWNTLYK